MTEPSTPIDRRPGLFIGLGGLVLALSVFLPWAQVLSIVGVSLLQIFRLANQERLAWLIVCVAVVNGIAGLAAVNRTLLSLLASVTIIGSAIGIIYYVYELTKTDGFVSPGIGMYIGAAGVLSMLIGLAMPPSGAKTSRITPAIQAAPPGWYPHDWKPGWVRWWNGNSYTHERPGTLDVEPSKDLNVQPNEEG